MADGRPQTLNVRFYDIRVVWISKLWTPDTTYKGQPTQKPTYSIQCMVPKTQQFWYQESALKDFTASCVQFHTMAFPHFPNVTMVGWPVQDGDLPSREGKIREWAKGHWLISANTSSPPRIEGIVDGAVVPVPAQMLGGRKIWDDGDHAIVDMALAKNQNDPQKAKLFVNSVCFCRKGEPIAIGFTRASGEELLNDARQRGLNPVGINGQQFAAPGPGIAPGAFVPPPGGAFGAPQGLGQPQQQFAGAFTPVPGAQPQPQPAAQGFGAPQPGFSHSAAPPTPAPAATGFAPAPAAPAPSGFDPAGLGGYGAPSPSSGFGQPGGWTPPQ